MNIEIIKYDKEHLEGALEVWNEVVREGIAFPQEEELVGQEGHQFFMDQSYTGLARDKDSGRILGIYILHPNNLGRCGHISNSSYAVSSKTRGLGLGRSLVLHSLEKAKELGFRILQFNAVVKTNLGAIKLYKDLGFVELGTIPGGFRMDNGNYEDIVVFYYRL